MKVRIKQAIGKSAPGFNFSNINGIDYDAREEVDIGIINYPGKYHPWLPGNQYANWDFWTNGDVDYAIIFLAHEIDALILTPQEQEELAEAPLDTAPFEVIVKVIDS